MEGGASVVATGKRQKVLSIFFFLLLLYRPSLLVSISSGTGSLLNLYLNVSLVN